METDRDIAIALICLVKRAGGTVEIPAKEWKQCFGCHLSSQLNPDTNAMELRVIRPVSGKPANVN